MKVHKPYPGSYFLNQYNLNLFSVHQVVLQGHPLGHHPVAQEVHHVHLHHPAHLAVAAVTMAVQGLRKSKLKIIR